MAEKRQKIHWFLQCIVELHLRRVLPGHTFKYVLMSIPIHSKIYSWLKFGNVSYNFKKLQLNDAGILPLNLQN